MPKDYDAWLSGFSSATLDVNGVQTAVYSAPEMHTNLPTALFIHGINGDYHGLVPVAYELRNECRVVFVDLPGHGGTVIPSDSKVISLLHDWSRKLLEVLRGSGFDVTVAVGHSFGCYVAQETGATRVGLLNPPFAASTLSRRGTAIIGRAASVVSKAYSSYPAMIQRGHWLMHSRTKTSDAIIEWSSHHTHVSKDQFKFQTRFATEVSLQNLMDIPFLATVPKLLIVLSAFDRIVDNASAHLDQLPQAMVVTLPTDHVSIFEMPKRVADEIRRLL
jgi:pimeloyl-ACP methyl ester carboxylesterase